MIVIANNYQVSSVDEFVPKAMDGDNVLRLIRRVLYLLPQLGNVIVNGAGYWIVLVAPDLIEQLFARHGFTFMLREVPENLELAGRQIDGLAPLGGSVCFEIEFHITKLADHDIAARRCIA